MTPREAELTGQLEAALRGNARLRQKIDLLVRRVFGSTSERLSPDQLELLALAESAPLATAPSSRGPSRNPFPASRGNFPRAYIKGILTLLPGDDHEPAPEILPAARAKVRHAAQKLAA